MPSSSLKAGIWLSACSMALSTAFCSLSSSTTTASMPMPVWNLISSMACRLVGSATARKMTLAAAEHGQYAVLGQQLFIDQPDDLGVEIDGFQVEQGHAEFAGGGNGDIAGIGGAALHQLRDDAAAVLGGIQGLHHGRLFDHAVLDQALRQSAEC
jgi:hypothetical protein